jgi:hypothetical protein
LKRENKTTLTFLLRTGEHAMPLSHKGSDYKGEGMEEKLEAAIRMLEGQGEQGK